jgi:hypothetical protein
MEPTPAQIMQATQHVHYEIAGLLLTPAFKQESATLRETVYLRKMVHGRVLFTFFSTPKANRYKDDVLSVDFGFAAEPLYGDNPTPLLDRLNKRIFHLTYSRIAEKTEWQMDELLLPVMRQSRKFIEHILNGTISIGQDQRRCWIELQREDDGGFPLNQNTSNVADHQIKAIERRGQDR